MVINKLNDNFLTFNFTYYPNTEDLIHLFVYKDPPQFILKNIFKKSQITCNLPLMYFAKLFRL